MVSIHERFERRQARQQGSPRRKPWVRMRMMMSPRGAAHHPKNDVATQPKRDYYEILGVSRSAGPEEISSVFQKLETEFHAAGKPKTIDDVEWLRHLVRAHDVLKDEARRKHYDQTGDGSSLRTEPPHGYDPKRLETLQRSVEQQTTLGWGGLIARVMRIFLD